MRCSVAGFHVYCLCMGRWFGGFGGISFPALDALVFGLTLAIR